MSQPTIISVVGARPQFVKLAPVAAQMRLRDIRHIIVHTGQHYDHAMSDLFFEQLNIPVPDYNLNVGSGPHGAQTGKMLAALEDVFAEVTPDAVLIYGDTNSTLAAAIAAIKMHIPLIHLEAGLRSHNRLMPEEHNRVLSDHAADLCLAPTANALEALATEGLADRSVLVGDVMIDVLTTIRDVPVGLTASLPDGDYFIATIHRAENTDDPQRLRMLIAALAAAPAPVVLFAHPRLTSIAEQAGIELAQGSIDVRTPVGYPELMQIVSGAIGVVTDSGGLQKEAFFLGVPTTTLRHETEWTETLTGDWNVLANTPAEISQALNRPAPTTDRGTPFGNGNAAAQTVAAILNVLN